MYPNVVNGNKKIRLGCNTFSNTRYNYFSTLSKLPTNQSCWKIHYFIYPKNKKTPWIINAPPFQMQLVNTQYTWTLSYINTESLKIFELAQVQKRINANKLSLIVQKPKYMIISNRNQIGNMNISLNGQPLARTEDDRLKFDNYIIKLCSKVT